MGLFDSFYDEDSTCPECHVKVSSDWQTKSLQSVLMSWHKGEPLQYTRPETIRKAKKRSRGRARTFAPTLQWTTGIDSESLLIFDGKVPVLTTCENCKALLWGYAQITDARFEGIVEIETDETKTRPVIVPEKTAKSLRDDYERRLSNLQDSCTHERRNWRNMESIPARPPVRVLFCGKCEKTLKGPEREDIDEGTKKRLRAGEKEFASKKYVVASGAAQIRRTLSSTRNLDLIRQACDATGRSSRHLKEALRKGRAEDKKREQSLERKYS